MHALISYWSKKCPKSLHHTSWGVFGHTNFLQLILLAQSGLFIYIMLTFKRIIVNWSNLSAIILTLHKKWSFPLRISSVNKCDQICRKLRIWSHLLKKSLMENFIFGALYCKSQYFLLTNIKIESANRSDIWIRWLLRNWILGRFR